MHVVYDLAKTHELRTLTMSAASKLNAHMGEESVDGDRGDHDSPFGQFALNPDPVISYAHLI